MLSVLDELLLGAEAEYRQERLFAEVKERRLARTALLSEKGRSFLNMWGPFLQFFRLQEMVVNGRMHWKL